METKNRKQFIIRLISFLLAILAVLIGFIFTERNAKAEYRTKLGNTYSKNLNELNICINEISHSLKKSVYTETPEHFIKVSGEIKSNSTRAKSALAGLPNATSGELKTINKFLSQSDSFIEHLSNKSVRGEAVTDDERETIEKLMEVSVFIADSFDEINTNFNNKESLEKELKNLDNALKTNGLGSSFLSADESIEDYPTLIYDGPFSDHLLTAKPSVTEGKKSVTREKARGIAGKILGIKPALLTPAEDEKGIMKSYGFKGENTVISITEKGGYPVYFRKTRQIKNSSLSYPQMLEKAKKFLSQNNAPDFQETYYFTDEGVCTINFAYKSGATVCYSDLIKVGVATDNGEIVLLESRGFLMNHKTRVIETPKYSISQAKAVLSKRLTPISSKQVIIPSGGKRDILCYEFKCKTKNNEILLVYVNCNTLAEENILTVLNTDGGVLVE